jgi:hypothetical protein
VIDVHHSATLLCVRLLTGLTGLTVLAATLASCGGGGGDEPITIYKTSFVGNAGWLTQSADEPNDCRLLEESAEAGDGYAVSRAPWWIDPNHAPPGLSFLHLVAFAFHFDWSTDGVIPSEYPGRPIDLRDATIKLRWRAPELRLPPGARFLFWLQAHDPRRPRTDPRYVNYTLIDQALIPVADSPRWLESKLVLPASGKGLACLGSNPDRTQTYDCAEDRSEVLANWTIDLGFIILFPDRDSASLVAGSVDFDELEISVPGRNLFTHQDAAPSLARGVSSCRGSLSPG